MRSVLTYQTGTLGDKGSSASLSLSQKEFLYLTMENTYPPEAILDDREYRYGLPLSVLHTFISQNIIPGPYPPRFAFSKRKRTAYLFLGGEKGLSDEVVFSVEWDSTFQKQKNKKIKQILAELALDTLIPNWKELNKNQSFEGIVQHSTQEYLKGILWNMEMYQKVSFQFSTRLEASF